MTLRETEKQWFMTVVNALMDSDYGYNYSVLDKGLANFDLKKRVQIQRILESCAMFVGGVSYCKHDGEIKMEDYGSDTKVKVCQKCGRVSYGDRIEMLVRLARLTSMVHGERGINDHALCLV